MGCMLHEAEPVRSIKRLFPALQPRFQEPLHVGEPNSGKLDDFLERVKDIFERRWFTNNGFYVQEFESRLKEYLGVKHCIPICNATIALGIAAKALHLTGEVIVPSFTFVATPHSLLWQNITPVFCDIDPETHNLDPAEVERLITPRTSAILGVHVWGRQCAVDALREISRKHRLPLLFDAAHAFGCSHANTMIGNFGDAEVFSFHATKFFNTFEGGAVATNDDELAARIRSMMNFGFAGTDLVVNLGINGKMHEVSAVMGITSLESAPEFIKRNYENYQTYRKLLTCIPGVSLQNYDKRERNNYQYIIAEIDETAAGFTRDALIGFLHSHNVFVRRYFYPGCHLMEPYRSLSASSSPPLRNLINTEKLCKRIISFPNGMAVVPAKIEQIVELIFEFSRSEALR